MKVQKESEKPQNAPIKNGTSKKSTNSKVDDGLLWPEYIKNTTIEDKDIKQRYVREMTEILSRYPNLQKKYCFVAIMNIEGLISTFDLDQIFISLKRLNPNREKNVYLLLLSNGGAIEPAYQISKLCKTYAKECFVTVIPRQAKSAATLLSLGADQIHMSPLGQLGPIDPQLGGLPALGVTQALRSLAKLSQEFPGSADMFARYLRMALTVEQIGYCERISESASQYAYRLLSKKMVLKNKDTIAKELVYEYKHHGFVIDLDEARQHLGTEWLFTDTEEISLAEEIYSLYDLVNLFLTIYRSKHLWITGDVSSNIFILDNLKS